MSYPSQSLKDLTNPLEVKINLILLMQNNKAGIESKKKTKKKKLKYLMNLK